jgi:hypothetical protein
MKKYDPFKNKVFENFSTFFIGMIFDLFRTAQKGNDLRFDIFFFLLAIM